jgi:alkylation response protein AidB-like acyl-CoA dehydrogenase
MTAIDVNEGSRGAGLLRGAHHCGEVLRRPAGARQPPEQVIAPDSRRWDVFRQAYQAGYHLRSFPPELGGPGLSPDDAWVVSEEFGWGNAGLSISMGVTSMPFRYAAMTGNPDLRRELVRPFVEDKEGKYRGCWCATEPNHGSDAILFSGEYARPDIHFECAARLDGDEWVINGQKSAWVSNGTIATHTLAFLSEAVDGHGGNGRRCYPTRFPHQLQAAQQAGRSVR